MISSYGKVFALGNPLLGDVLSGPVVISEKQDGSNISVLVSEGILYMRSRNQQIDLDSPGMFQLAVDEMKKRQHLFHPDLIYRAEFLSKPKHNSLTYERVPKGNVIVYDIEDLEGNYRDPYEVSVLAAQADLECVPTYFIGECKKEDLLQYLDRKPLLGGPYIEGIVIKNYNMYTRDGKIAKGKLVREDFKELHRKEWKVGQPGKNDIIQAIIEELNNENRWNKSIQHLAEKGELQYAPQDIGPLLKEIQEDILSEETERIKEQLFCWAKGNILRGAIKGFPEYWKRKLFEDG